MLTSARVAKTPVRRARYNPDMPSLPHHAPASTPPPWFARPAGRTLLASEHEAVLTALRSAPTPLPWLWIAPLPPVPPSRDALLAPGVCLASDGEVWSGSIRCRLPLPFASESLGTVILQHVAHLNEARSGALLAECARALVPGGRLHVLALNPLSPYRLRWLRSGLRAADSAHLRRLLADVGLSPMPQAQGLGPQWRLRAQMDAHDGPGLRAAYLQSAEKRSIPLTPARPRLSMALPEVAGVTAARVAKVVPIQPDRRDLRERRTPDDAG